MCNSAHQSKFLSNTRFDDDDDLDDEFSSDPLDDVVTLISGDQSRTNELDIDGTSETRSVSDDANDE